MCNGGPENININVKINVYKPIAHGPDNTPGDTRNLLLCGWGNLGRRFTDNLNAFDQGKSGFDIPRQLLTAHAPGELNRMTGSINHVL